MSFDTKRASINQGPGKVLTPGPSGLSAVCSPLQVYLARAEHSSMYACGPCGCLCCMCDDVQLEGQLNAGDAGEGNQAVVAEQCTRLPTARSSRQCEPCEVQRR